MSLPAATYGDFRTVLKRTGFELIRSRKHEVWRNIRSDGAILRVVVSHQGGRDIPRGLFAAMCRQAGITPEEFFGILQR